MSARKPFLLRIDADVLDAVQRWATDDLRSLNGQIEFLLRRALADRRRAKPASSPAPGGDPAEPEGDGGRRGRPAEPRPGDAGPTPEAGAPPAPPEPPPSGEVNESWD